MYQWNQCISMHIIEIERLQSASGSLFGLQRKLKTHREVKIFENAIVHDARE